MKDLKFISPFKKLCITIGNLPTAYIESMSYYEGLTFLVNYLANNVIPAVNNNSEVVKELQDQFVILKNYVDNYFDNLDVQEEINTKLDEMADSGELTDIIAQYLGLAGILAYGTVADMKAAENLVEGSKCETYGYHSINDGGAAKYNIRKVLNTDVIDESFIIALNDDTLIAELIIENDEVNIKQLGAYGDKYTDDTLNIQSAINTCIENDIGELIIPNGEYLISSTLNIKKSSTNDVLQNFKIIGTGKPSIISSDTFTGNELLLIDSELTTPDELDNIMRYITIQNINFGKFRGSTTARGITIKGGQYFTLENISIRHCLNGGIKLIDCMDSYFGNIHIYGCGIGNDLENNSIPASGLWLHYNVDSCNANKFVGLHIEYSKFLLHIQSRARHNQFLGCKFESTINNDQQNALIQINGSSAENTFTDCQFVKNGLNGSTDTNYFINAKDNGSPVSDSATFFVKFDGCMATCSTNAYNTGLWLDIKGCTVINSTFNHSSSDTLNYPFVFEGNNIFVNNKIYNNSTTNKKLIYIKGNNNIIKNNIWEYTKNDITNSSLMRIDDNVINNEFIGNIINGVLPSPYLKTTPQLGQNIFKDNQPYKYIIGPDNGAGNVNLLYGCDTFIFNDNVNYSIANIRFGYNSQIVTLIDNGTGGTHTLVNSGNIVTSTRQNVVMAVNTPYIFININGTYYQI